ncbi:hypothetical protein [Chryseobacterium sp. 18068]|uniref:phosphoribosyltransferase-like protein n=1 Tax=Chryseobacterium sp. 18068 TaxID=2681414 RepID=UPI0013591091|nr:hypothetical protein [Chryseobacterium sp. 18068]
MEEKIDKIISVIGEYRAEDIGRGYRTRIDADHFKKWLGQFEESDREFLVDEMLHVVPKSYLTKEHTLQMISTEFDFISKHLGYDDIDHFFDETEFLDCQPSGKSQKVFLGFIDELLKDKYGRSLSDCGTKTIKQWFYTDDVMASGGTFREDILSKINEYGKKEFIDSNIKIIGSFVILHTWASKNVRFIIDQKLGLELKDRLRFYRVSEIENIPYKNYFTPDQKFNLIYPLKSSVGEEVLEFVEENLNDDYEYRNEKFAFRNVNDPKEEHFFSSSENRIRYEHILLDKGFEIIKSIDHINANSLRPLGMTNPSNKTLGTGTHFFTWRNVSNTCPIVFWWGSNDWYPLFPAIRNNSAASDIDL